jgi:phosphate transport system permease protein
MSELVATTPAALATALIVTALAALAYRQGAAAALAALGPAPAAGDRLNSLPGYHGWLAAIWTAAPALAILALYGLAHGRIETMLLTGALPEAVRSLPPERLDLFLLDARRIAFGGTPSEVTPALEAAAGQLGSIAGLLKIGACLAGVAAAVAGFFALTRARPSGFRARARVEGFVTGLMIVCSGIAILTTAGIVLSLLFETLRFFTFVSPLEFLFGTHWSPQIAIRADQAGASGVFGALPLFYGTFLIMAIAMLVAAPVGLGAAIYLSEYAKPAMRRWVKPALELLAGIPTVVYGFFALLTVAPLVRSAGEAIGLDVSSQSALAAGLVMGIMILPFISSLSDDVINAVPQTLRDGAYALGATKSETIRNVVVPAALPGIVGSMLLAVSRALGETMIVTMAAGQAANFGNPLEMVTTVTVQIVTLLTGDQEFDSPKTLSAFALGFVLFTITLALNVVAMRVVQKYREKYD